MYFDSSYINLPLLKKNAFNLRWAEVGNDVIPMTAADLDFPCAPPIREAVKNYASQGYFNYGPSKGLPVLKESLSEFFLLKRHVNIHPDNILPVDSAAFGIYLSCKTVLSAGDEAIIFDPVDFLFRYSIESVGAKAIPFSILPGTHTVDFSQMEKLITPKTKMICLCNPLNPTGKVFTVNELTQLVDIAAKYGLIILSDEIWSDIVFAPHVYTSVASISDVAFNNTIIVTGFSKSYGLAGLRIGALLTGNKKLFEQICQNSLHQSTVHGVNTMGQIAASAALKECQPWLDEFLSHLHNMRNLCVGLINDINGFSCIAPEGCYVAFVNIKNTGMSSSEMHSYLLNDAKVAVVPGLKEWFGDEAEGYIRLSFATSEDIIRKAFERISASVSKLENTVSI
jgi:aminotransferase